MHSLTLNNSFSHSYADYEYTTGKQKSIAEKKDEKDETNANL